MACCAAPLAGGNHSSAGPQDFPGLHKHEDLASGVVADPPDWDHYLTHDVFDTIPKYASAPLIASTATV